GDPFAAQANTLDSYTANRANEYTQVRRDGRSVRQAHDRAGNMTRLLVRPVTDHPRQPDVLAAARWDAFHLLFDIDTGATPQQQYRYDAFRRRIVALELDGRAIQAGSRRYIYDGWNDIEERLFDDGATLATAPSTLERIYVNGREVDEPLLTAIDRNGDGRLGGPIRKNVPDVGADQEYYFLNNRLGSIMALLDADRADRVLKYCRYTVYGEATEQPVAARPRPRQDESAFGNVHLFAGRRFDHPTGLYYNRSRYYEPRSGRFIGRNPKRYVDGMNLYGYVSNNPTNRRDPLGLDEEAAGGPKYGPTVERERKRRLFPSGRKPSDGTGSGGTTSESPPDPCPNCLWSWKVESKTVKEELGTESATTYYYKPYEEEEIRTTQQLRCIYAAEVRPKLQSRAQTYFRLIWLLTSRMMLEYEKHQ
ncbi:MAG: RHS repeat-associated core domain-containing protein, partial [Gammaproteobacteria bacterium]